MMLSGNSSFISSPFSLAFSPPKRIPCLQSSFSFKPYSRSGRSPPSKTAVRMSSSQTLVEHVVLFKVKENTDPSKVNAMVTELNSLVSIDEVLHLAAGPVFRNQFSSLNYTHALHSRYKTKEDLEAYAANPSHVGVVNESVLPIIEDAMAVDWIADGGYEDDLVAPPPGSAVRLSFLKLKESLGDKEKSEILGVIKGLRRDFPEIKQITCGENFSPARAKGYSLASFAVFPGMSEMDAVDAKEELVNSQKEKIKEYLESMFVVDYVIPAPASL
ncbi:stress-response A/B barrel domain-containing protein UP3-like [Juglans regia]|uniref:Stress-response A/B barrel domain-containing protein UP3-like n=2 Tax=Juglans regia TaxID=51240 RepID=A0A2I4GKP8_JUGRE|nr:stress-response A/B barrel domain-containing protein UP3-like [Juglans regia]